MKSSTASSNKQPLSNLDYALAYAALGWHILPLHHITEDDVCSCGLGAKCPEKQRGKHPDTPHGFKDATDDPRQVTAWWSLKPEANIGCATGLISGIWVLDVDPRNGGNLSLEALGEFNYTVRQESGGGGEHYFFKWDEDHPAIKEDEKSRPGIDIQKAGSYIILAPSNHKSGGTYTWDTECNPLDGATPCRADAALIAQLAPPKAPKRSTTRKATPSTAADIPRVKAALACVPPDARETWVEMGMILRHEFGDDGWDLWANWAAESEKYDPEDQARVWASFKGSSNPKTIATLMRTAKECGFNIKPFMSSGITIRKGGVPDHFRPNVFESGTHIVADTSTDSGISVLERTPEEVIGEVLSGMPAGTAYRRAGIVVEVANDKVVTITPERMVTLIDSSVRLVKGNLAKPTAANPAPAPSIRYAPCSVQTSKLVLATGNNSPLLTELIAMSPHPVLLENGKLSKPGWNEGGIYVTSSDTTAPLARDAAVAVLEELTQDFPWASPADRANFYGMLLTPIIRHYIQGNAPMHLITAPEVATGKTLLASGVLGGILLGDDVPITALGTTDEEINKLIMGNLLRGQGIICYDNLTGSLNSESLIRLITGKIYSGRVICTPNIADFDHRTSIVATGNNVTYNVDMARRLVKIRLEPVPASRTFQHPDLPGWIKSRRGDLLGALLGLVVFWTDQGGTVLGRGYPTFENWAKTIGGILTCAGWDDYRWPADEVGDGNGDGYEDELASFVTIWAETFGSSPVSSSQLVEIAQGHLVLDAFLTAPSDAGKRNTFCKGPLNTLKGRRYPEGVISKGKLHAGIRYWIK